MGISLAGLIARSEDLVGPQRSRVLALEQGWAMLLSEPHGLTGGQPLYPWVAELAERLSERHPVAYIEAEFFGGTGAQAAIGWQAGAMAIGPLHTEIPAGDDGQRAINRALCWLGIERRGHIDEFDAVGLGRLPRATRDGVQEKAPIPPAAVGERADGVLFALQDVPHQLRESPDQRWRREGSSTPGHGSCATTPKPNTTGPAAAAVSAGCTSTSARHRRPRRAGSSC